MFGLLNVDKPAGVTSRDVVNRVQRLVKPEKVGHCGTLDPLATGVLIVAIGPATRLVEYVQRMPKTYRGTFLLGRSSDTEDIEGNVTLLANAPLPTEQQVRGVLSRFIGTIEQVPPVYSALKVGGQRSYDLARRGQTVELQPRVVEIHAIDLVRYAYPELELLIRCGSGTYIRSLARDLARALGTEAVMSALRREAIGPFLAAGSTGTDDLTPERIRQQLLPPRLALGALPEVMVSGDGQRRLALGQSISLEESPEAAELVAIAANGTLLTILRPDSRGTWKPAINFAAAGPQPG